MKQSILLSELIDMTNQHISEVSKLKELSDLELNWKENEEKWSVLECIEHLCRYGDFYLPEFERVILKAKPVTNDPNFKSGWFGEKTVTDMLPKDNRVKKMNTFKSKNPSGSDLSRSVLDRFLKQEQQLIGLLEQARSTNLAKEKCRLTLPIIKFSLGTTFRFVINHNERHLWQVNNVLKSMKNHPS